MKELEEYFKKLRFDKAHHLGLGDIRLTIGQQEEIVKLVKEYAETKCKRQREICKEADFFQPDTISDCCCDVDYEAIVLAHLATEEEG